MLLEVGTNARQKQLKGGRLNFSWGFRQILVQHHGEDEKKNLVMRAAETLILEG